MHSNSITLVLLIPILLLAGCTATTQNGAEPVQGRVVFSITDAAADLGAVSSIDVTIDRVEVHNDAEGWVTVSDTPKTYDLLELRDENGTVALADVMLDAGTYQQIRMEISDVTVTDAEGEEEAKLPSGELRLVGNVVVEENITSAVTFDFIANESLHTTGNGRYIFAPVIQLETRTDADVAVAADYNRVRIRGGTVTTATRLGMDVDGNVGAGLTIPAEARVDIGADGRVVIGV